MKKVLRIVLTIVAIQFMTLMTSAQISINSNGDEPHASAMLDISSANKGILIPRMSTEARVQLSESAATALLVFDTNTNSFWFYNGTAWDELISAANNENSSGGMENTVNGVATVLEDTDGDTKIQVEESPDEDIIRFDAGGVEYMNLSNGVLGFANNGNSVFLGRSAGVNDDKSNNKNAFVGAYAGNANTTGAQNTVMGFRAFQSNQTGRDNVAIGGNALRNNTNNSNVSLGKASGYSNVSGSNNIFLGYQAGHGELGSNKLYIESSNSTSPLIYGEFDNDLLQINGTLNINGVYAFPTADGNANQVLATDGNGVLTWADNSSNVLADADNDTKIVVEQSADEDTIRFYTGGVEYFKMNDGRLSVENIGNSIFIGEGAGANDDLTDNYNVFVGHLAGNANTTGFLNTFTGYLSGQSNTTGTLNTFYGARTGYSNTTGFFNTFTGTYSGALNTTGSNNTFYGGRTGTLNTTGSQNIFIGRTSGYFNTTGSDNTFLGYSAGISNQTGSNNLFLGYKAGFSNVDGGNNVFIGNEAGYNELGSDKLYINNDSSSTPLIYGEFDNDLLQVNGTLNIDGAYEFPTSDGNAYQVLATDGNGTLTWKDNSATVLADADNDTKIVVEQSADEDTIRFYTGGVEHFKMNDGRLSVENTGGSVFIGEGAGANDDLTDNNNVFVGHLAGNANTTGFLNTFTGYLSGQSNTTGTLNTFYGARTGYSNTTGFFNTFTGTYSGALNTTGSNNTFYGGRTGTLNTTGGQNVFVGRTSGYFNTTGSDNVFLGYSSGISNQTGSNNLYLGHKAGFSNVDGGNNVFIGNEAGYNELGSDKLYINNDSSSTPLVYGDFATDNVIINGDFTVNGNSSGTSPWTNSSDRRLKDNIETISNALDKIAQMRGVTYTWRDNREEGNRLGFIAQEVAPVLPEVVNTKDKDHLTMQYAPITAVLVEAIKEQQQIIEKQQAEIDALKAQNAKINQLEAMLMELKAEQSASKTAE
jgi:hypothetical protein